MQGNADLYRYSISAQSSEAIASVSAQGKMMYSDSLIYIMDNNNIEALAYTDTSSVANLQRSTIAPAAGYRFSGITSSATVSMVSSFYNLNAGRTYSRDIGLKQYELKDHLGNVRVIVSDVKEPANEGYTCFNADLLAYYNYYAFGMIQPDRNYNAEEYKFGFNGMEMDNEITGGTGEHYDFGARIYSSRLGRWMTCDPLAAKYSSWSPYNYCGDNPIFFIDPDGKVIIIHYEKKNGQQGVIVIKKPSDIEEKLKDHPVEFVQQMYMTLDYLKEEKVVLKAITSKKRVNVIESSTTAFNYRQSNNLIIEYNPTLGLEIVDDENAETEEEKRVGTGKIQSPAIGFFHEIGHFVNYITVGRKQHLEDTKRKEEYGVYHSKEEKRNIDEVETPAAKRLGEWIRTNHSGITVVVEGPTSTTPVEDETPVAPKSSRNL